jgi:ribose 5-phosphate isomerase B
MKLAMGSDHGGWKAKNDLMEHLRSLGHDAKDFGCFDDQRVDYPKFAFEVAEAVASGGFDRGILICTTGQGMCMAANKVRGIRAALCQDDFCAKMTRLHNDANVLCLGAKVVDSERMKSLAKIWLETEFEGGRHAQRVEMLADYERKS